MARKKISRADTALYLERDPYTDVVARLEPKALRALAREMPRPDARYAAKDVDVDVYCAKRLYHPTWKNPVLFRLVIDARGSYYRYGDYPPLDAYDRKSAVYITRVRYAGAKGAPMEEWLSVRFIPWRGTPYGFEDLKFCAYKGKTIDHWVQKKFPRRDGAHALVSISRVCGVQPYPARAGDEGNGARAARMRHTALAFAAMNNEFFNAGALAEDDCAHVTTLMHRALVARSLGIAGRDRPGLRFTAAHRTLGLAGPAVLARDGYARAYCERFPQYFLDVRELIGVLRRAVRAGDISHATLAHYMGPDIAPEALLRYKGVHISALRGIGAMLGSTGTLHQSAIDGEALRGLTRGVADGPALYMMERRAWEKSVWEFCRALKLNRG